jgi:hypothetical protein
LGQDGYVYYGASPDDETSPWTLNRISVAGGEPTELATIAPPFTILTADANAVYIVLNQGRGASSASAQVVTRVALEAPTLEALFEAPEPDADFQFVQQNDTSLYVETGTTLHRLDKDPGAQVWSQQLGIGIGFSQITENGIGIIGGDSIVWVSFGGTLGTPTSFFEDCDEVYKNPFGAGWMGICGVGLLLDVLIMDTTGTVIETNDAVIERRGSLDHGVTGTIYYTRELSTEPLITYDLNTFVSQSTDLGGADLIGIDQTNAYVGQVDEAELNPGTATTSHIGFVPLGQ